MAGLIESGIRLANLFIDFRNIDFRQRLPRADAIPDIDQPLLNVALVARENGRFSDRLNIARQVKIIVGR